MLIFDAQKAFRPLHRVLRPQFLLAAGLCLGLALACPADDALVPLNLKLPAPAFVGTPKEGSADPNIEPVSDKPRPKFMVPADVKNLAPGTKITCSDANANAAALAKLTDGNKEAADSSIVLLKKVLQWVQFDLGQPKELFAIVLWHAHDTAKIYRDVIAVAADDADFKVNVRLLFNNDRSNESGLGAGTDRQYYESYEGRLIPVKGVSARYLRFYSHGSTDSAMNEYTEVEIYGRPVK